MTIEERLKIMMCEKCGTVLDFSKKIGIPNSTTANILKRGIRNAGIENIIKICAELEISVDELANGRIVRVQKANEEKSISDAIESALLLLTYDDATFDGEPLTEHERWFLRKSLSFANNAVKDLRREGGII